MHVFVQGRERQSSNEKVRVKDADGVERNLLMLERKDQEHHPVKVSVAVRVVKRMRVFT